MDYKLPQLTKNETEIFNHLVSSLNELEASVFTQHFKPHWNQIRQHLLLLCIDLNLNSTLEYCKRLVLLRNSNQENLNGNNEKFHLIRLASFFRNYELFLQNLHRKSTSQTPNLEFKTEISNQPTSILYRIFRLKDR